MILQKIAFSRVFWWLSFGEGVQVHHFISLLISYWKGSLLHWQVSSWHAQWGCVWGEKWKRCRFFPLNQPPSKLNKFAFSCFLLWNAKFWTRCWKVFNAASSGLEPIRDVFYSWCFLVWLLVPLLTTQASFSSKATRSGAGIQRELFISRGKWD